MFKAWQRIMLIDEDDERCSRKEHESNVPKLMPTKASFFFVAGNLVQAFLLSA